MISITANAALTLLRIKGESHQNYICLSITKNAGKFYAIFKPATYDTDTLTVLPLCIKQSNYNLQCAGCVTFILRTYVWPMYGQSKLLHV